MTEPQSDDCAVHAFLKKIHSDGMSKDMNGYAFLFQRRANLRRRSTMLGQHVLHTVNGEALTPGIGKE